MHPDDRPDPGERFRADLAGYLAELPGGELANLLGRLPDPVKVDLISELTAGGPAWLRLPPTWPGHPDQEHDRRRSLREVVADRRADRAARRAGPPPGDALQEWARTRPHGMPPATDPAIERRLGEALRGHAAQRNQRDEGAAMAWDDPGCPREPEPPAQCRSPAPALRSRMHSSTVAWRR